MGKLSPTFHSELPINMLRAAMIMMLCCVSDAFVLQPAASRALAPARHSSVAQMLLPTEMLLPMTSLAEAGQAVAMKETPWALIVAGCVVTTLSAGFPVFFMKEAKTEDSVKMASMEKAMAEYEIVEEDKLGNVITEDKPPTV